MASPPYCVTSPGAIGGAVLAEVEDAVGRVGLDVIHLVQAAIEAELQLLPAQLFGQAWR